MKRSRSSTSAEIYTESLLAQREIFEGQPIRGFASFAQLVGRFYQLVVAKVLSGEFADTNGWKHICPDVWLDAGRIALEVKASCVNQAFRIPIHQYNKYVALSQTGKQVLFGFLEHGMSNGYSKLESKTIRCALEHLSGKARYLVIFDCSAIQVCYQQWKECGYEYPINKMLGSWGDYIKVPHAPVRRFTVDPVGAMEGLGLSMDDFTVTLTRSQPVTLLDLMIPAFPVVWVVARRESHVNAINDNVSKFIRTVSDNETEQDDDKPF